MQIYDNFEKNSLLQKQRLLQKLEIQDKRFNNFKVKVLAEQQRRSVNIDNLIISQNMAEESKQKKICEELSQLKSHSKKLHTKILQLQMMDKSKKRTDLLLNK